MTLSSCLVLLAACAWVALVLGGMFGTLLFVQNKTVDDAWQEFERARQSNLERMGRIELLHQRQVHLGAGGVELV